MLFLVRSLACADVPIVSWSTSLVDRLPAVCVDTASLRKRSRNRSRARSSLAWNTFTARTSCIEYVHPLLPRGAHIDSYQDLKADNILVEMNGICKISDFGISKRTDDIEQAGAYTSMQGTVFWMAPEVINAQKSGYNSKVDIWSVGCVVYEMWTGQRPWNGQEAMAVLLHVSDCRP